MKISFDSRESEVHLRLSSGSHEHERDQEEEQLVGLSVDESRHDIDPEALSSFLVFSDVIPSLSHALLLSTLMVVLSFIPQFISLCFIAQVPNHSKALKLVLGVGVAQIWIYTSHTFFAMSMGDSLCVLASKMVGTKSYEIASNYFNKMLFLGLVTTCFNCSGFLLAPSVFDFFQIGEETVGYATHHLKYSIGTSFLQMVLEICFGYITAMDLFYPVLVCRLIAAGCHLVCAVNLIIGTNLELYGLALTNWISYSVELVSLLFYLKTSDKVNGLAFSWPSFSVIFKGLFGFIWESTSIGIIFYLEFQSMEIVFLIAGFLNDQTQLSTLVFLFPLISVISVISLGIGYAGRAHVNSLIGNGYPNKAKLVVAWLYGFAFLFSCIECFFCGFYRMELAGLMTEDGETKELLVKLLLAYLPNIFNQNFNQVNSLVMKSLERQSLCIATYIFCFFLFIPPTGYFLAIHTSMKSFGIVGAIAIGSTFCNLFLLVQVLQMDWDHWFGKSFKRLEETRNQHEMLMLDKKEI